MAGLGQALTGVNQANQRAEALRRFNPAALAGLEQFLGLDPQQKALAEARLALLRRAMGGEQAPGSPGQGTAPGEQTRASATPSFERASDERRTLEVLLGGDGRRLMAGAVEGPEARALASMQGPAAPPFDRMEGGRRTVVLPEMAVRAQGPQAVAARGAPMGGGFGGGEGGGGDLPPELAGLLGGLQAPRTRGELARMEPQLQLLERMLAQEQAAQMKRALAELAAQGKREKEAAVERRHGETIGSREKVAGESLEQRKAEADELNKYRDATLTLRGRAQQAHNEYRKAMLDFKSKAEGRAGQDKFFKLVSAYSQVGLSMGDRVQRAAIQAQLGREIAAEMKARGFPNEITAGVVEEQPGYFERAMNWLRSAEGAEKPKPGAKPAAGGAAFTFED